MSKSNENCDGNDREYSRSFNPNVV
ncbi:unnamed protein product [Adineta ricciae]|uniref:Uncharacterized protein n=1 Tax=Adineta ricciae TaxID=249248 RepID=A0A815XM36_ADIRI|nr:unnamed protein product [Adineta ricciae]